MVEQYLEQFLVLADGLKLSVLVAMIFANLVLGIAVSIYTKTFRLKAVADFLISRVLPYVLSYFAVVAVAIVEPAWEPAVTVVFAFSLASLTAHILGNLKELGIKLPDSLAGRKE